MEQKADARAAEVPVHTDFGVYTEIEALEKAARLSGWRVECRQVEPGPFFAHFTSRPCEFAHLASQQVGTRIEVTGTPPEDAVAVIMPRPSHAVQKLNSRSVSGDQMIVMMPGSELHSVVPAGARAYLAHFPMASFLEEAGNLEPDWDFGSENEFLVDTGRMGLRRIRRAVDSVLYDPPASERCVSETTSELIEEVVKFAANARRVDASVDRPTASRSRAALKRARDYIDAHLPYTVRMADVCREAAVSIRTLERLFLSELGLSPSRYLRARRLNAVRRRLLTSMPGDTRVMDVALGLGFTHMGRFAGVYRHYFNETPRQTLSRHPGSFDFRGRNRIGARDL